MSSKHKDLGVSAYQPIRSRALSSMSPSNGIFLPTEIIVKIIVDRAPKVRKFHLIQFRNARKTLDQRTGRVI